MTRKVRVLVVDDSAVMREALTRLLGADAGIEVIGAAADPYVAREMIKAFSPDVLTLDVEMPRMDGLTFLEKLMRGRPMPVVMVSSLTEAGCEASLRALELGAVDFVAKPKIDLRAHLPQLAGEIAEKVKAAAQARVRRPPAAVAAEPRPGAASTPRLPPGGHALLSTTHKVIALGASTGGTEALREFLVSLPADAPGVVIVQHMPENFTRAFARRLDEACAVRVKEAVDGDRILTGHVLLAPGNQHMRVVRDGAAHVARLSQEAPVTRHRPSVDVLFQSCADALGPSAVGVILTGMGDDGARGMLAMRRAGSRTLAQDEASCVVFGMPKVAIEMGGVEQVLPLAVLARRVLELCAAPGPAASAAQLAIA